MDLEVARTKALSEMKKHGLISQGWTFEFDRAVHRLGLCNYNKKKITVSKHFTGVATLEEFEQALLHEIAHAVLPAAAKHGLEWVRKSREIGYNGKRLANNPYAKIHRAKKREERSRASRQPFPETVQGNLMPPKEAPKAGDSLILPNGLRLRVSEVTAFKTKAVAVDGGEVWLLNTSDAIHLLKR